MLNFTESSLMHFTWTFKLLKSAFVQAGTPRSNWVYIKEVGLPQGISSISLNLFQSLHIEKLSALVCTKKNALHQSLALQTRQPMCVLPFGVWMGSAWPNSSSARQRTKKENKSLKSKFLSSCFSYSKTLSGTRISCIIFKSALDARW